MEFLQAVSAVLLLTLFMALTSYSGLLDKATVELGLEHYAEKQLPHFPKWLPMPLNTGINIGYTVCGLSWILFIRKAQSAGAIHRETAFMFYLFDSLGSVYGFVQLYRIVYQTRCSAIIDQWITLPFFMLVYLWAKHVTIVRQQGSWRIFCVFFVTSVLSYSLSLLTVIGFEISLGCHIAVALYGGTILYRQYPSQQALRCFILAAINCAGFVVLKLLDHHLPALHWIFNYVSGHFLSKICDVLQFHYVNKFFAVMTLPTRTQLVSHEKLKLF